MPIAVASIVVESGRRTLGPLVRGLTLVSAAISLVRKEWFDAPESALAIIDEGGSTDKPEESITVA